MYSAGISLFSYVLSFTSLTFRGSSPCLLLVCLSYVQYILCPDYQSPKQRHPSTVLCSLWDQSEWNYSAKLCSVVTAENVFPRLFWENISFLIWKSSGCIWFIPLAIFSSFCFAFNASLYLVNLGSNYLFLYIGT